MALVESRTGGDSVTANPEVRAGNRIHSIGKQLVDIPLSPVRIGISTLRGARNVATTSGDLLLASAGAASKLLLGQPQFVTASTRERTRNGEINPDSPLAKLRAHKEPPKLTEEDWAECEKHFRNKHLVSSNGDTITYVVIPPLPQQEADKPQMEGFTESQEAGLTQSRENVRCEPKLRIFMAPGWSERAKLMKEAMYTFAKMGYEVITLDHARKVDKHSVDTSTPGDVETEWVELLKSKAIVDVVRREMEGKEDKRIGIFTHSEGTINGSLAALEIRKEGIADVVAIHADSPAGLNGDHSFGTYLLRGIKQFIQGEEKAIGDIKDYLLATKQYLHLHPITLPKVAGHLLRGTTELVQGLRQHIQGETHAIRSASEAGQLNSLLFSTLGYLFNDLRLGVDEVFAIAHSDAAPVMRMLTKQGVPIFVSHGVDDVLIPLNEVQDHVIFAGGNKERTLDATYHNGDIGYLAGFITYGRDPENEKDDEGYHLSLNMQASKVAGIADYFFSQVLEKYGNSEVKKNAHLN